MKQENARPGVSGKSAKDGDWVNREKRKEQQEFRDDLEESVKGYNVQGRGGNLHGRSDLGDQDITEDHSSVTQEQIAEALRRSPMVDVSRVKVSVDDEVVLLEGIVENIYERREIGNIVRNVPGVRKIKDELMMRH